MHQDFMTDCDNAAEQIQQIIKRCNVLQNVAFKRQMVDNLTGLADEFKRVRDCESNDFDIIDFCKRIDCLLAQIAEVNSRINSAQKREVIFTEIKVFTESFDRISCRLKQLAEMKKRRMSCSGANCSRRNIKF